MDRLEIEKLVLRAALEDIQTLAAPRHIDRVAALVGMDMVQFAKLGAVKMSAVIWATLEIDQIASCRSSGAKKTSTDTSGSSNAEADKQFK